MQTLNITGRMRNHHLAGAIADAACAELARILGYKQQWRGGQVPAGGPMVPVHPVGCCGRYDGVGSDEQAGGLLERWGPAGG